MPTTTKQTIGERIADEFSTNKSHLFGDEKRALARLIDTEFACAASTRVLLHDIEEALDDRYDGAPDSPTLWMGEYIDRINKLIR